MYTALLLVLEYCVIDPRFKTYEPATNFANSHRCKGTQFFRHIPRLDLIE